MLAKTIHVISLAGLLLIVMTSCGGDDDDDDSGSARLPDEIKELDADRYMSSILADFDGDSDLDLMLGGLDRSGIEKDLLLINDGQGNYEIAPTENMPNRFGNDQYGTVQLRADDFDNDGDNDVLAAVHGPLPSQDATVMLYLNNGSGTFTDASNKVNYVSPSNGSSGLIIANLEIADLDDDGDVDFLLSQGGTDNAVYLNDGNANFTIVDGQGFDQIAFAFHLNAGDVDDDGDTDIIALPNVFLNDGANNYTTVSNFENFYQPMFGAVLQKNSGNPIVVGVQFVFLDQAGSSVKAFRVDGIEQLSDISTEVFSVERNTIHPRNLYVADFDGNGTEDLVVADHGFDSFPFPGTQNALFLQQTDGTLLDASGQLPQVADFTHDIAIGDIDGDGDIDIYASNLQGDGSPQGPYFMINDGAGNFTQQD